MFQHCGAARPHFLGESANSLVVEWATGTTIEDSVVDGVDLHARHHDWQ